MNDKYTSMKNIKTHIDFAENIGRLNFKNHSFGIGGVNPAPMTDKMIKGTEKLKPQLIRIFLQEFFFIEKIGKIGKENGELDFTVLDKYMKAVNQTGADIMASICIKPPSVYPIVDETVWKPADVERWQYIIGEMTKRYSVDNKYVTHWGVGNEINIGEWGGCPYKINDVNDYFEYYKMTVEPILKVYPEAKVGGPSWAGPGKDWCEFCGAFLDLCMKEKIQVDFVSYNIYSDSPDSHVSGALEIKKTVDKYNSEIKIYITECNIGIGNEISVEEKAYASKRAAGLGAILYEYYKRAGFIGTFQYHLYDQFCDPNDFKPFYARHRYMANHWNDEPHRLGLFDGNGRARPQYYVYSMLYAMAENEVSVNLEVRDDTPLKLKNNIKVMASYNDKQDTIFISNYNDRSSEDITMSIYFKNAKAGKAQLKVYRIDCDKKWDENTFELLPTEDRAVYVHDDFWFSVYVPADSVLMIVLDMD